MSERRAGDHFSPADLVTIANAVLGFLAIVVLVRRWALHPADAANGIQGAELKLAAALIGAGALCDVVDGVVARATWSSRLGNHLDGMADTITFGVAPALVVAVAGLGFPSPLDMLALAAATTHVVAVVARLARHAVASDSEGADFMGVTSPIGAMGALAVIALDLPPALTVVGIFAMSGLMLGRFYYPHQTRPAVMAVAIAFVLIVAGVITALIPLRLGGALGLLAIVVLPIAVPALAPAPRPASSEPV
jgi:CDP-diacylglycerol--serine O-phosphatidyltransferase